MPTWNIESAQKAGTNGWHFQDRIAVWDLTNNVRVAAVFDGHGPSDDAVDYCCARIKELITEAAAYTAQIQLKEACATLAKEVLEKEGGTTCSIALLFPNGFVSTAIIGDSPIASLMNDRQVFVGEEHNIRSNKNEAEAAIARGGIIRDGYLYAPHHNQGIQLARSLGDGVVSMVLSTEPSIESFTVSEGYFLFLASDGLVDLSSIKGNFQFSRIIDWIHRDIDPKTIVERSHAYWEDSDDISLVVCRYT